MSEQGLLSPDPQNKPSWVSAYPGSYEREKIRSRFGWMSHEEAERIGVNEQTRSVPARIEAQGRPVPVWEYAVWDYWRKPEMFLGLLADDHVWKKSPGRERPRISLTDVVNLLQRGRVPPKEEDNA